VVGFLLQQLATIPGWALIGAVGLLVFLEDAVFIGFVLPGETAAILAGASAKLGHVSLTMVLITVIAAAVVGDSVGYEVGKHVGSRVLALPLLHRHRNRLDHAQNLLARRGGSAVLLARWVAFLRAVMPALAGAAGMRYRTFLAYNAAGGIAWGSIVVLAGFAAGASYQVLDHVLGPALALVVAGLLALGWIRAQHRRPSRSRRSPMRAAPGHDQRSADEGSACPQR
jgi:membrane-associated protein